MKALENHALMRKIAGCVLIALAGAMYACGWIRAPFFGISVSPFEANSFLQDIGAFSDSAKIWSMMFLAYMCMSGLVLLYTLVSMIMNYTYYEWIAPVVVCIGVIPVLIIAGKYEISVTVAPFVAVAATIAATAVTHHADEKAEALPHGRITAISGAYKGWVFDLEEGETLSVGRDPALCSIVLKDPGISRQHCTIRYDAQEQRYYIKDQSANGTFMADGVRVPPLTEIPINRGERIYLYTPEEMFAME